MQVMAHSDGIELVLFEPEAALLESVLTEIADAYNRPPETLAPGVRYLWFPGEGLRAAEMNDDDIEVWNQSLAEFRSHNGQLCQTWLERLDLAAGSEPRRIGLPYEQADNFITVINDYRLLQAAEHEVEEADMDKPLDKIEEPELQGALLEIHFLGWLMELVLDAMNRRKQSP
ncbi:MAG: hypothetical protein OHK005_02220 [Candidatus Methylacidiphilales bacterium]